MAIPKGILATDKWFTITNYAGNDMDTTSKYYASATIDRANMGKINYSINLSSIPAATECTRSTCVPYPSSDTTYFSIIEIFNHLTIRMKFFMVELYALNNCIQSCKLTPVNNPTSCVVDSTNVASIQYCNKQLYGTNANPSIATNEFKPYMNYTPPSNKTINLDSLPSYKTSSETTLNIQGDNQYKIHPNPYFDLNKQYTYITNLFNTFKTILDNYVTNNSDNANAINQKYSNLLALRSNMDAKLEEIFGKNNTMNMQLMQYYDSTIYTSIFWTVLVTTLLFYTFRKL